MRRDTVRARDALRALLRRRGYTDRVAAALTVHFFELQRLCQRYVRVFSNGAALNDAKTNAEMHALVDAIKYHTQRLAAMWDEEPRYVEKAPVVGMACVADEEVASSD